MHLAPVTGTWSWELLACAGRPAESSAHSCKDLVAAGFPSAGTSPTGDLSGPHPIWICYAGPRPGCAASCLLREIPVSVKGDAPTHGASAGARAGPRPCLWGGGRRSQAGAGQGPHSPSAQSLPTAPPGGGGQCLGATWPPVSPHDGPMNASPSDRRKRKAGCRHCSVRCTFSSVFPEGLTKQTLVSCHLGHIRPESSRPEGTCISRTRETRLGPVSLVRVSPRFVSVTF